MSVIERLDALEILDSRGRPTVQATCHLRGGAFAKAQVPSGASTGSSEALELRDSDPVRYAGLGCRRAVGHVRGEIQAALQGVEFPHQSALDQRLIQLDGTPNKSRLGANAILAVSLAFARAQAQELRFPLYRHLADIVGHTPKLLPALTVNLFSGGKHAGAQVAIQDVLVVPLRASSIAESLADVSTVIDAARRLCARKYHSRALVADEGGLAPPFANTKAMLDDAVQAIEEAGFTPGQDCALAVDVAASHFYEAGSYLLDGESLNADAMLGRLEGWLRQYPILSLEDGLAENDWDSWPRLVSQTASRAKIIGDDLLCTNPGRIREAIRRKAATALLLKVNQIGTLTEAAEARRLARDAGWEITISARSGETEDDWLADLAFGWGANYIKVGSLTRSERLAKYNRLLEIESAHPESVCRG